MNRLVSVIGLAPSEMELGALVEKVKAEHARVAAGLMSQASSPKRVAKAKEISEKISAIEVKAQLASIGVGSVGELERMVKELKAKEAREKNGRQN
jgi:hypothetical protein